MVVVSQSDVVNTLPKLLDDIESQSVLICRDGQPVGAVVSMEDFDRLKRWDLDRLKEISLSAGEKFAEHAAELGITPEDLLEKLLSKED